MALTPRAEPKVVSSSGKFICSICLFSPTLYRNEVASSVYTTEMITKMFKEEGGSLFDARLVALGHTLQGNIPSPIDRTRAVRLSLKCMAFIEKQSESIARMAPKARISYGESAAVITIQGTTVSWVAVKDMVGQADMKNRRGKNAWWEEHKILVEALAARPQLV